MFSDLLTFTTPKFQRANMMVALLQIVLKKGGNVDAHRLEGLDVTNPAMAHVAIEILSGMQIQDKEASDTKSLTLSALHDAIRPEAPVFHVSN